MPALNQIKFPDVKFFQHLSKANVGKLLQIENDPKSAQVCLRAELPASNGISEGVVFLEGDYAGLFRNIADLSDRPAFDLTDLAEIVLSNPSPKAIGFTPPPRGIFQAIDRDDKPFFAMSVFLGESPVVVGYLRLTDPDHGKIVNVNSVLYLGGAAVVEIKSEIV